MVLAAGRVFSSVVLLSTVLWSCGGGTTGDPLTPQQLGDALPTVTDLGQGWSETQRDVFTNREPENPSIDPSLWCDRASTDDATMQTLAGDEGADAEFELSVPDGFHRGLRIQAWNNPDAKRYMTALDRAFDACNGEAWDDGAGSTYSVGPSEGPDLGDDSVHWTVRIDADGGVKSVWVARQWVVRTGYTIVVAQLGDVGPGTPLEPMDDEQWSSIVSEAIERINSL